MGGIRDTYFSRVGPVTRSIKDPDVVAIDFETFYCDKAAKKNPDLLYSISSLGAQGYVDDPRFDPYLVAVKSDSVDYVGPLSGCPWDEIDGKPWVAHNMSFDAEVAMRAQDLGMIPGHIKPASMDCTADLGVFLNCGRSLAMASEALLGEKPSKGMRDYMDGRTWEDAVKDGKSEALVQYGRDDARLCWTLAREHGKRWPDMEIRISRLNRRIGSRGAYINRELLEDYIKSLKMALWIAGSLIPWEWGPGAENKTPLSLVKAREQCRIDGIPAPTSFSEKDDKANAWEDKYADQFPWIRAIRVWRKANRTYQSLLTIRERLRPDGTFPFSLLYFGAHTGRFSGAGGFNMQNLPKYPLDLGPVFDDSEEDTSGLVREIDVRPLFIAPPGMKVAVVDLSQIEARVLLWLAGDETQLEEIRKGAHVYEAHARATMGWTGGPLKENDRNLYALAKARVLGLGYGCGPSRFVALAKIMAGLDLSPSESSDTVLAFRATNRPVTRYWSALNRGFKLAMLDRRPFRVELPSGRKLRYFNIHMSDGDCVASNVRGFGPYKKFFGGKLAENVTQAASRDLFCEGLLRVEDEDLGDLVFHVHDEGVWYVPSEESLPGIEKALSVPPDWAEDLPVSAEGDCADFYQKPD